MTCTIQRSLIQALAYVFSQSLSPEVSSAVLMWHFLLLYDRSHNHGWIGLANTIVPSPLHSHRKRDHETANSLFVACRSCRARSGHVGYNPWLTPRAYSMYLLQPQCRRSTPRPDPRRRIKGSRHTGQGPHSISLLCRPGAFPFILSLTLTLVFVMFSFRYTIVLAAVTLALAAPLRLRDGVNVAIPFDPVTGDQCNLNLDANALVLKVSPEIESCVGRSCALMSLLTNPCLRSPDLSNPFCSPINNENTGGALLVCKSPFRLFQSWRNVDSPA
jgi:hypothetical protein